MNSQQHIKDAKTMQPCNLKEGSGYKTAWTLKISQKTVQPIIWKWKKYMDINRIWSRKVAKPVIFFLPLNIYTLVCASFII